MNPTIIENPTGADRRANPTRIELFREGELWGWAAFVAGRMVGSCVAFEREDAIAQASDLITYA